MARDIETVSQEWRLCESSRVGGPPRGHLCRMSRVARGWVGAVGVGRVALVFLGFWASHARHLQLRVIRWKGPAYCEAKRSQCSSS